MVFHDGALMESTGLNGASTLRQVELETGRVLKKIDVPQEFFAEGLTLVARASIYQLTWQTKKGFVYDAETFQQPGEFPYAARAGG